MGKPRRVRIKFKHHPIPPTSGCTKPFGLCIIIPINFQDSVTPEEYEEGYGIAICDIVDDQVHMIFERRAALDNGTVPIQNDWNLGEDIAEGFDCTEIVIQEGEYEVDFSTYDEFGEAYFDAEIS